MAPAGEDKSFDSNSEKKTPSMLPRINLNCKLKTVNCKLFLPAPHDKVGLRDLLHAQLPQHVHYLPAVIRAVIEQVQQHLVHRLFEAFLAGIVIDEFVLQGMFSGTGYPLLPLPVLLLQQCNQGGHIAGKRIAGSFNPFLQCQSLPPDAFRIQHVQHGFVNTGKTAAHLGMLLLFGEGEK